MVRTREIDGRLLFAYPESENAINDFGQAILRGPSSLTLAERELIATVVSARNECHFCSNVHAATARHLLGESAALVDDILEDIDTAALEPKMRALLAIAERVRLGQSASADDMECARAAGADDRAIHDTVLIAAMLCMFNRYVDGFGQPQIDRTICEEIGVRNAADESQDYDLPIEILV